jgi:hypothetical protein
LKRTGIAMDVEQFFEKIEWLLEEGRNSQATDLLTVFLLELYGQPTGLSRVLPDMKHLSRKSSREIVDRLKEAFSHDCEMSDGNTDDNDSDCEDLSLEDLEFIEENSIDFEARNPCYELEEEIKGESLCAHERSQEKISPAQPKTPSLLSSTLDYSDPDPSNTTPVSHPETPDLTNKVISDRDSSQHLAPPLDPPSQDDGSEEDIPFREEEQVSFDVEGDTDCLVDESFDNEDVFLALGDEEPEENLSDEDDLDAFEGFDDEFDDAPSRPELSEVLFDGVLTNEERAYQIALQVGLTHDLDPEEIDLIHEIFKENGWSQARVAIERELRSGTTLEELMLAKELKTLWDNRPDFAIGFNRSKKDKSDYTYSAGRILSWVMALDVVRLFPRGVDFSELEFFLDSSFESWFTSPEKRAANSSFLRHLYFLANEKEIGYRLWPDILVFCERDAWGQDETVEALWHGSPVRSQLLRMGVNPDPWLDSYGIGLLTPNPVTMNDY